MKISKKNPGTEILSKASLLNVNGGGETWIWIGKVCGNIKNAVQDMWENWSDNCAYNAGMAKC
jgi:hypothetical protein